MLVGATLRASSALPASDPLVSTLLRVAGLAATAAETCREPLQRWAGWQADGWQGACGSTWPRKGLAACRQVCCSSMLAQSVHTLQTATCLAIQGLRGNALCSLEHYHRLIVAFDRRWHRSPDTAVLVIHEHS